MRERLESVTPKAKTHLQGLDIVGGDSFYWLDIECVYGFFNYPTFLLPPNGYYYFKNPDDLIRWHGWGDHVEVRIPRVQHRYYPVDLRSDATAAATE